MKAPGRRFRLEIRALRWPGILDVDPYVRLRQLLKIMLRRFRFECIDVREIETPAEPVEARGDAATLSHDSGEHRC